MTARAASASAAILVLIGMRNSILLQAAVVVRMPSWTEGLRIRFDHGPVSGARSARRAARKCFGIEFVDIDEQFTERGGAMIE